VTSSPSRSCRTSPELLWTPPLVTVIETPPHASEFHPSKPPPLSGESLPKPPCLVGALGASEAHHENLLVVEPPIAPCTFRRSRASWVRYSRVGFVSCGAGPMVIGPSQARLLCLLPEPGQALMAIAHWATKQNLARCAGLNFYSFSNSRNSLNPI
jgi:hypothetical protein